MEHRNYITLVDEIIRHSYKEMAYFADTRKEAESMCDYLEQRIKELCKDVKEGLSKEL